MSSFTPESIGLAAQDLDLGLEGESGGSLGVYSENSEKIEFEDFPDQRVEGNRIIIEYRWR